MLLCEIFDWAFISCVLDICAIVLCRTHSMRLEMLFFLRFSQVFLLTANIYVKRRLSKCALNFRTFCNCVSCGMKLVNWTGIEEEQQSWLVVVSFACWSVLTPVPPNPPPLYSLYTLKLIPLLLITCLLSCRKERKREVDVERETVFLSVCLCPINYY